MSALVWTAGTGQAWWVPSGVLPPNLSPVWAVCIEMHGSCSTNDGTAVGQQRWEFSGAWPKVNQASGVPTKVDFNSISRFCANAQTWWGTKSFYLSREQKIRYLQVTTCRELFPTTVAVDTLLLKRHQAISSNHAVNSNPPPDFIWDFSLNTIRVFPNDQRYLIIF